VRCKGRPPKYLSEILLNRILSLWWEKGDVLKFNEIHREFVRRGVVSNIKYRGNTVRILNRLIERGYLERVGRGKYRLKVSPKPFQIVELINKIREEYGDKMIYEWRVGGHLWTLVEGILLGLPRDIEENPMYKAILKILLIRLANIFNAIVELGVAAKMSDSVKNAPIPYTAVREFILNSLPHVIGEYSGIDGDGLPAESIVELYKTLVRHTPRNINSQPILVDVIREYIDASEKLLSNSADIHGLIDTMLIVSGESKEVWRKIRELEKIILVAYPPRHLIDENEDERELYELLRYSIKEGYSDAMLLAYMRVYDENIVKRVMNYLEVFLGEERKSRLMELYKLARAGMILDSIISTYFSFKKKRGKPKYIKYKSELGEIIEINEFADRSEEEVLSELRKELDHARRHGYTLEDMVKGIWLSNWSSKNPRFTLSYYRRTRSIVKFVKKAIKEVLKAINVSLPRNFDELVEEGYKLVEKLDELLKSESI